MRGRHMRWWWFSCKVMSKSCNPMDYSPLGSSVHGIVQTRTLEWVAISFSRGSSPPRDLLCLLHWRQILYHCYPWLSLSSRL